MRSIGDMVFDMKEDAFEIWCGDIYAPISKQEAQSVAKTSVPQEKREELAGKAKARMRRKA